MSLTDTDYIRQYHSLGSSIPAASFLENMILRAERLLREWVGDAAYDDAALPAPSDSNRAADLKAAEAELVMYFAIPKLHLRIGDQGIIQSGRFGSEGGGNFTLASPNQIREYQAIYFENAELIATPYIGSTHPTPVKVSEEDSTS